MVTPENDSQTAIKLNLLYLQGKLHVNKPFQKQLGIMARKSMDNKNKGMFLSPNGMIGW